MSALSHVILPVNRLRSVLLACLVVVIHDELPAQLSLAVTRQKLEADLYGNLYLLNTDRNVLRLFDKDRVLKREIGGSGWENDQFDRPAGLWARNGIDVFVADYGNHRIQRFDRNLSYVSTLYTRENPNPDFRFGYPTDVALSRLGDLFICDSENSRIVKVNRFTQVERTFGGFGAGEGRLYSPTQVEIGPKDNVYVLDRAKVLVFDNSGNFLHNLSGVFCRPSILYASDASLAVVDSSLIHCFNSEERHVASLPIERVAGGTTLGIWSMTFTQDSMIILNADGFFVLPDPRRITREK